MKYIKFIGRKSDLKGMGYTFQKLFGMNYNCWHKSIDEYSSQTVWIWDKGKQVEIIDLHQNSYIILEEVIIKNRSGERLNNDTMSRFMLEMETKTLHDYDFKHTIEYKVATNQISTDTETLKKAFGEYADKYRTVRIDDKLKDILRELWQRKMIEISEKT